MMAGAAAASQGGPRTEIPETTAPQPVQRENVEQALLQRERNRSATTTDGSHESDAVAADGRAEQPKVSLWSQDDYVEVPDEQHTEGHYTDDHYKSFRRIAADRGTDG